MGPNKYSASQFVQNLTITASSWSCFEEKMDFESNPQLSPSSVAKFTQETLKLYDEENRRFLNILQRRDCFLLFQDHVRDRRGSSRSPLAP
jgi:hypothetical protein